MTDEAQQRVSAKQHFKSNLFHVVFTNLFSLKIGANDVQLVFGLEEGAGDNTILEEVNVAMTLRTAKYSLP
jgi:hypothetical protein